MKVHPYNSSRILLQESRGLRINKTFEIRYKNTRFAMRQKYSQHRTTTTTLLAKKKTVKIYNARSNEIILTYEVI